MWSGGITHSATGDETGNSWEYEKIDTSAPTRCQYAFSKLSDVVFSDRPLQLVNVNAFKADLGDIIDFADIGSAEELYVILKAGFFELHGKWVVKFGMAWYTVHAENAEPSPEGKV